MELAQSFVEQPLYKRLKPSDWLYAVLVLVAAGQAWRLYNPFMDGYEQAILAGSAIGLVALGWFWKSWRWFFPLSAGVALLGISLYHGQLARAQTAFWLKFLLSSQSAIMWMCTLFFLATLVYWAGLLTRSAMLSRMGSGLTWAAAVMGAAGLFVRWYESYLIGSDVGHIPVSNLYEVFILFTLITALMYLYYEARFATRQAGAFVLLVISAAVGFILWYSFDRQAHEIQPLIPALQSWWMKIHVPANFVGYGAFAMSAMLGVAELLVLKGVLKDRLPSAEVLDEMMYKAISIGFPVLHHRHHPGRDVGCRRLGRLLELGPEGNLGADRVAELRRLAAHPAGEGLARRAAGLVGGDRPGRHQLRLPRRQHVPVRPAFLRRPVNPAASPKPGACRAFRIFPVRNAGIWYPCSVFIAFLSHKERVTPSWTFHGCPTPPPGWAFSR